MKNKKDSPSFFSARLRDVISSFALLSFLWLLLLLLARIPEIMINQKNLTAQSDFLHLLSWGWYEDFNFWADFVSICLPGFFLIGLLSLKVAKLLYKTLICLFVLIHVLLLTYFNRSLVLLGEDFFNYSVADIIQTVGASGGVNMASVFLIIGALVVCLMLLVLVPKKIKLNIYISVLIIIFSLAGLLSGNLKAPGTKSEFAGNLIINKSHFFYRSFYSRYNPEIYETDIYSDVYIGASIFKYSKAIAVEYLDEENFPFLHKESTADVLSPFFNPGHRKPDIVIIVVEGLGRSFSNSGANLGSFTPFLDSLSTQSMYWKNFISNGGRTFAVLPSILGSLPFGESGFMAMQQKMPQQHSLINLLAHNGYRTSFYYGGDSDFDNMREYLEFNNIDVIQDLKSFPQGYKKLPSQNGFSWGYNDNEIFRNYLIQKSEDTTVNPELTFLLTLASHSPFVTDESEKYGALFEERLKWLQLDEEKKERYRNYKAQYASVLYADDAVRKFFKAYKKRKDFSNTIFIITGDHRIPEIPMSSKIDRYHVPLIIYSPLLTRTAEIASVSSHFDVAPSLLSYLKTNHNLKLPKANSFLGNGLDTTRNFQNIHEVPLMQAKSAFVDFIKDEFHLNGEQLYKLNAELGEIKIEDKAKKEQMVKAFNDFKLKNRKLEEGANLFPDSLVIKKP